MVSQEVPTIFDTDLFFDLFSAFPSSLGERQHRVIADHARGACFLISDGVRPSNKERGYVLRRILRRLIVFEHLADEAMNLFHTLVPLIVSSYHHAYPELHVATIIDEWDKEKAKFLKTVKLGLKELAKYPSIDGMAAFKLYESYGLPYEIIKEFGGGRANELSRAGFDREFRKHQEISRAGLEKKFGGHGLLLDTGELKAKDDAELAIVTRLHTATHILQQALRAVLGPEVRQAGSDITVERTRFDFSFHRKMTDEEMAKTEEIINQVIQKDIPVLYAELPKDEAAKTGALFFFKEKYPDIVKVYYVGHTLESAFSKEFCGGPHVIRTGEIGKVKIVKQESCGAGVRRVRAVLVKAPSCIIF